MKTPFPHSLLSIACAMLPLLALNTQSCIARGATPPVLQSGKLVLSAHKLKFPTVGVGSEQSKDLLIQNGGDGSLQGNVGSLDPPFSVVSGGGAFSLAPTASLVVTVQLAPDAAGSFKGNLGITSNDP